MFPCSPALGSHFLSLPRPYTLAQADSEAISHTFQKLRTIEMSLEFLSRLEMMVAHGAKSFFTLHAEMSV